jgi:hypothetical protein
VQHDVSDALHQALHKVLGCFGAAARLALQLCRQPFVNLYDKVRGLVPGCRCINLRPIVVICCNADTGGNVSTR